MSNKSNQESVFVEKALRRLPKGRDPILEGQNQTEVKKEGKKVVDHVAHSPDPQLRGKKVVKTESPPRNPLLEDGPAPPKPIKRISSADVKTRLNNEAKVEVARKKQYPDKKSTESVVAHNPITETKKSTIKTFNDTKSNSDVISYKYGPSKQDTVNYRENEQARYEEQLVQANLLNGGSRQLYNEIRSHGKTEGTRDRLGMSQ